MRKTVLALLAMQAIGLNAALARAPETTATPIELPAQESVKVSGVRDPDFKPYQTMLLGPKAFEKHHQRAPNAELKYVLRPQVLGGDLTGVTLRVANDENSVAVPVAADGTFVLVHDASVDTRDAELFTNRKKGSVRWRPYIMTPGLPADTRRLGDLRAECEVRWAVERDEVPFFKRALLSVMGACTNQRVYLPYYVNKPLANAILREGARTRELVQPGQDYYVPPLADESWSDDALIELRYQAPKA